MLDEISILVYGHLIGYMKRSLTSFYVNTLPITITDIRSRIRKYFSPDYYKALPNRHQIAIAGLVCFAYFSLASGTTLIIRRTDRAITVGADSLASSTTFDYVAGKPVEVTVPAFYTCKIVRVGKRAVVWDGYYGNRDDQIDITALATSAYDTKSLERAADSFVQSITEPIRRNLERIRVRDLANYRFETTDPYSGK